MGIQASAAGQYRQVRDEHMRSARCPGSPVQLENHGAAYFPSASILIVSHARGYSQGGAPQQGIFGC
jgi:hypothetical protein